MVPHRLIAALRSSHVRLTVSLLIPVAIATGACHKMPLVAPSGTAITVVAAANAVQFNGSTDLIAVLVEGGQTQSGTGQQQQTATTAGIGTPVHNGTLVTFTTTLGRIEPVEARTEAGKAMVKLIADGRTGTAIITAFSGGSKGTLELPIVAPTAARIIVTATPTSLPASGGTTTISARAEDAGGLGVVGLPVSFSTTAGTLAATPVLTGDSGIASTTLTTTQAATVTVTAAGTAGTNGTPTTLTGTVNITLKPRTTLTITPPATATQSVPATITIGVGANSFVTDVLVEFGDGGSTRLGSISASTNVVHLYADGVFTIRATATDIDGTTVPASTDIVVVPLTAVASASPSAPPNATTSTPILFSLALPANASIDRFEWDFGDFSPIVSTSSNAVSHVYASPGIKTMTVKIVPTRGKTFTAVIQVTIG